MKQFLLNSINGSLFRPPALIMAALLFSNSLSCAADVPEKVDLKFGFIKLTDMAPLAVAYEKHYFEDEGLYVTLEAQANWKVLLDRVISGELDGAHMLADRVVMMTNGPNARVGKIMEVDLPRPRTRKALVAHEDYYHYREQLIGFLADCDNH